MRTHISIGVTDVDRAVAFYAALLGAQPAKKLSDYALFVIDEPPLELALDHEIAPQAGTAHYGLSVDHADLIDAARTRLLAGGYRAADERGTCCYARQEKIWTADPDGRPWEVYHVLEETAQRDGSGTDCCRE